jgi:hypothetical protein
MKTTGYGLVARPSTTKLRLLVRLGQFVLFWPPLTVMQEATFHSCEYESRHYKISIRRSAHWFYRGVFVLLAG